MLLKSSLNAYLNKWFRITLSSPYKFTTNNQPEFLWSESFLKIVNPLSVIMLLGCISAMLTWNYGINLLLLYLQSVIELFNEQNVHSLNSCRLWMDETRQTQVKFWQWTNLTRRKEMIPNSLHSAVTPIIIVPRFFFFGSYILYSCYSFSWLEMQKITNKIWFTE